VTSSPRSDVGSTIVSDRSVGGHMND
jgi:hypothetical protein